jgi:hypothetical protein
MRNNLQSFCVLFLGLLWTSCGGSGSGGGTSTSGAGGGQALLTFAVTDAPSDDLASFTVELEAVQLKNVGGSAVGVLPRPATVDLVTLKDVSQILGARNVPPGLYVGATVSIDFTDASAVLVGQAVPAQLLDVYGHALTGTIDLPVTLVEPWNALVGANQLLELDFDLDLSVRVNKLTNTVTVEPMLVVRVDPTTPKPFLIAGELESVDLDASSFRMEVQSFGSFHHGHATIDVKDPTVFQVDGVPNLGATGLGVLDTVVAGTWVQAYGTMDRGRLQATIVEAGTGTYNGGDDIVDGHVIGRVGGAGADATLSVLGRSSNASHSSFRFNRIFTVSGSFVETAVVRRGNARPFDLDDVNIGQRVRAFGTLSGLTLDVKDPKNVVRLERTRVLGFANDAVLSDVLALDLVLVGPREAGSFAWSEGGTTPVDPDAGRVSVAGLGSGLSIAAGSAIEVEGFFSGVDEAGEDFISETLANRDTGPSLLFVHNLAGGFDLTPTASANEISLAITGDAAPLEAALLDRGFIGVEALPLTPTPTVRPAANRGFYNLLDRGNGTRQLHVDFEEFAAELDTLLSQGAVLRSFAAVGNYDGSRNSIAARIVSAVLE